MLSGMGIERHGTGCRRHDGITVLELMITLALAAILLASVIPSFRQFTLKQQIKAATESLHADLLAARSAAVFGNASVVACPGNPGTGCSGSNDWSDGWIVFTDDDLDRQRQPQESLLRHGQGFDHISIRSPASRTEVRFFPDGSTPGSNGSISLCGLAGPSEARKIIISNIGRIRRDTFPNLDPANCPQ